MPPWLLFYIEWTAVAFGVLCVILVIRRSIWCWPTGLVQVALFLIIFQQAKLYSDFLLHVIYVAMQIYGWWAWLHGGAQGAPLSISRLSSRAAGTWAGVAAVGIAGLGLTMHTYTDAALPYWDAATTVLSLIAQYLLARKVLENWVVWIVVDVLCIGIYSAKQLYPTAGLYAVFLILAIIGLISWRKVERTRLAPAPA